MKKKWILILLSFAPSLAHASQLLVKPANKSITSLEPQIQISKQIYLTIDDGPSKYTPQVIQYLKQHKISAIFYCRGKAIEKYKHHVVQAIKEGFLIGNHSYSHPHFSEISLEECFEQILKTEKLIDECYTLAQVKRPIKVIRLPYGDRGAGDNAQKPTNAEQKARYYAIQNFLVMQGFSKLKFEELEDEAIDALWNFNSEDYEMKFCKDTQAFSDNLQKKFTTNKQSTVVILMHDFDFNHQLFTLIMNFLKDQQVTFKAIP